MIVRIMTLFIYIMSNINMHRTLYARSKREYALQNEVIFDDIWQMTEITGCTQCCTKTNGINEIYRQIHNIERTKIRYNVHGLQKFHDCHFCPVTLNMSEEKFQAILAEIDGCP